MNVIVACEMSGIVRDAFARLGHNAISVDLLDTERPGNHHKGDLFEFMEYGNELIRDPVGWCDLMVAHPDCTHLTNSASQWFYHPDDTNKKENLRRTHPQYPNRWRDHYKAVNFFMRIQEFPIKKMCIENPIPSVRLKRAVGNYSQIVQPHWFGDPYKKATCLWLRGLDKLERETWIDESELIAQCHEESPGPMRKINRSRTYPGIANAMAKKWSEQ